MAIHLGDGAADEDEDEETDDDFEARIYDALMKIARSTSGGARKQLGACVLLGTPYEESAAGVKDAIRRFIAAAEL